MATPLESGRACLAGEFFGRTWIAVATFDATSEKATITVIHEAKDVPDRTDMNQWQKTTVGFTPAFLVTLTAKSGPGKQPLRRVLVGRTVNENIRIRNSPLLIDPDRGTGEVLSDPGLGWPPQKECAVVDGVFYVIPTGQKRQLVRFAVPELKRERLLHRQLSKRPARIPRRTFPYRPRRRLQTEPGTP